MHGTSTMTSRALGNHIDKMTLVILTNETHRRHKYYAHDVRVLWRHGMIIRLCIRWPWAFCFSWRYAYDPIPRTCIWFPNLHCDKWLWRYPLDTVGMRLDAPWSMHAWDLWIRCGSRPYCTLCKHSMDNLWLKFVHFSKPDGALEGT